MSHFEERVEKNCLNCNARVYGRFCHICGQENITPKESVGHLFTHFFKDITHFDGKFFSTIKHLLFRPGFLSNEYMRGRRKSYVNPVRLYVFTSFFFFLIYFSFYAAKPTGKTKTTAAELNNQVNKAKNKFVKELAEAETKTDSTELLQKIKDADDDIETLKKDSTAKLKLKSVKYNFGLLNISKTGRNYTTLQEYDSVQKALPDSAKDSFFPKLLQRRNLQLNEKYGGDGRAAMNSVLNDWLHRLPQMLFVSLPFFALLLQLLYIRQKKYYYVNHSIYSIHLYCAFFIFILAAFFLESICEWLHWTGGAVFFAIALNIGSIFYFYKAQRNFYTQGRFKTLLKIFLLFLGSVFVMIILFTCFLLISTFSI